MNNKQNTNSCYVFSQATLDIAIEEWVSENTKKQSKEKEVFLIVAAAIPWFLKHLTQSASIYMFTQNDLKEEIKVWQLTQEAEYPHQKERIDKTCNEIISFFNSEIISRHKMIVET